MLKDITYLHEISLHPYRQRFFLLIKRLKYHKSEIVIPKSKINLPSHLIQQVAELAGFFFGEVLFEKVFGFKAGIHFFKDL
jgi:hypothetical protein